MAIPWFLHGSGGIRGHLPDAGREGGVAAVFLRRGFHWTHPALGSFQNFQCLTWVYLTLFNIAIEHGHL